jgi:riboflavin-specific deaminase-like protein
MSQRAKKSGLKLPFVFMNMAMTADGKIATANRVVHTFGSSKDLEHLYELRATADAIICGARTVEISQATLGNGGEKFRKLRLKSGLAEFPVRVVVTGSGSIDPSAKIFQKHFSPLIVLTTQRAPAKKLATLRKLADEVKIYGKSEVNFPAALAWLRKNYAVKRLLCEGGGELNNALFRADLVGEINLTICPKIFGGHAAPTIADGKSFARLELTQRYEFVAVREKKGELFTTIFRAKSA